MRWSVVIAVSVVLVVVVVVVVALARPFSEDAPSRGLDQLAWMVGAWAAEHDGGMRVEEHWIDARGGNMMGLGRTTRGDRMMFYEFLRIEQTPDGTITYHAAPKGRSPATPFKMIEMSSDKVVFENPQHDFPVRITYWREGADGIGARIEGKDGKNPQSWVFKRVKR
jgi:hypothetical protein